MRKRISALLLSAVFCLVMVGTVFAAEPAAAVLTNNNGSGLKVELSGLGQSAEYYQCSLLVKKAGAGEFTIARAFNFATKADGTFKKTFTDPGLLSLQNGDTIRINLPGVSFTGGQENHFDYTLQGAYTINVSFSGGGSVKYNGSTTFGPVPVNAGEDAVFIFAPDDNAHMIDKVLVDGAEITPAPSSYTFHNVSADHSLRVTFKEVPLPEGPFRITASANGGEFPEDAVTEVWTDKDGHLTQEQIDSLTQPTMEGYTFKGWYMEPDHDDVEVTPEIRFTSDYTIEAQWTSDGSAPVRRPSGGGGGGSTSSAKTNVRVSASTGGSVSTSPARPTKGQTVTVTLNPKDGYTVDQLVVKDSSGKEIELTKVSDTQYTFVMPDSKVTIDPTFKSTGSGAAQEPTDVTFNDVPASFWANKEINWAGSKGIMSGYGGGVFAPNRQVTRQQLWMVLGRLNGANPSDMKAARAWAMTNGVSDGSRPVNSMTRQQMVTMLYRYAQMKGYATTGGVSISSYPDASKVSSYAQEALSWAVGNGIMLGDSSGSLNPTGTASRAHFAVFMYRFCTLYDIA